MEGIGWNIVWAVPLAPDQDMLPSEETTGILPTRSLTTHDRRIATSFFPSFQVEIETILSPQPKGNLLLCAYRAAQQGQKEGKHGRYHYTFFHYKNNFRLCNEYLLFKSNKLSDNQLKR